jgi:hypothetical protein
MKTFLLFLVLVICFTACKKTDIKLPLANSTACRLTKVSTTGSGTNGSAVPEYATDGKLIGLKHYNGNSLESSTTVGNSSLVVNYKSSSTGYDMIETTIFQGSISDTFQLPVKASIALQEGLITHTDVWTYFFYYDTKNRLAKVSEETPNVAGDWEYDLFIRYDENDNVAGLKYTNTTGPNTSTVIVPSGYDDKQNPYSSLITWRYLANWGAGDPSSIFAQLSKNNPLGFTLPDGFKKTNSYTYNDKGFPVTNISTNTNISGGNPATSTTTYNYLCQ